MINDKSFKWIGYVLQGFSAVENDDKFMFFNPFFKENLGRFNLRSQIFDFPPIEGAKYIDFSVIQVSTFRLPIFLYYWSDTNY